MLFWWFWNGGGCFGFVGGVIYYPFGEFEMIAVVLGLLG